MIRFFCLALILLTGVQCAWGQGPAPSATLLTSPRIAVVGAGETADLVGLLTADLSNNPDIALVERTDLAKVGDEAKLQQLAGHDAVALGKLVGADGLVFISKSPDGLQVRFTAAGLGYALFDERFETTADLPHLAEVITQRVTDYAPKLKLRPGEAIPISLLNLRSDVANFDQSDLERKLSLLLESRLASVSKYVILERRHGSALKFERLLTSSSQVPMQGVSVIDGTLTLPAEGKDDVTVHLRLRPSGAGPIPLDIHGSTKDLPALAQAMATAIGSKMNVATDATAWQPQKEAREYLLEGIWGLKHNAETAALEALDAAELLGASLPDVTYARVPVLCGIAVGTASIMTGDHRTPDDPHPEARIEAILRVFPEEVRYENENMPANLRDVQPDNSMIGNIPLRQQGIARAADSLLTMLDAMKHPRANEVRSAFRDYVGYDPWHGKYSQDLFRSIRYIDSLSQTEEEEKAYYRILLASPADSLAWQQLGGVLNRDSYCARFYPEVDGSTHARYVAYLGFLKSLSDGPCRLNALLYYAAAIIPNQMQEDACKEYYQALTDQRDNLAATNQLAPYLAEAFHLERTRGLSEAHPQVIALLHFLLQHVDHVDGHISQAWVPDLFPPSEAPALWKEFQALEAKSVDSIFITHMRESYLLRFGNDEVVPSSLEVKRFWYPPNAPGKPTFARSPVLATPNGIWMAACYVRHDSAREGTATAIFYRITLDISRSDPFSADVFRIPDFGPRAMAITPDALYIIGSPWNEWKKTLLQRFDLSAQRFEAHEVPQSKDIFEAGGKIYLALCGFGVSEIESGIALFNDKTSETTILASSRRRPAQNQFDDRSYYSINTIFTGSGNRPCASIGFGEIYAMAEKPGAWTRVMPSGELTSSQTIGSRTLLSGGQLVKGNASRSGIVFMVDSTKPNPELWLGAPGPLMGTEMVGKPEPLPPQPDWSQHPLWQQPQEDGPYLAEYGFRGDDLFNFGLHNKTQEKELLWYRHGQATPIRIPLSFKMNDEATNALKAMEEADDDPIKMQRPPNNTPMSMFCTPQGLCFLALNKGFWFLPFSDIDAYLKTAHN